MLSSWLVRKMQTRTIRYHYTPFRMAKIRNTDAPNTGEDVETLNKNSKDTWEDFLAVFLIKVNILLPYDPIIKLLGIYPKELKDYIWGNQMYVKAFMEAKLPKVKVTEPEGTYLMWLDFSAYGLEQEELMRKMNEEALVWLNSGDAFGEEGNGFVRMNAACPRSIVKKPVREFRTYLAKRIMVIRSGAKRLFPVFFYPVFTYSGVKADESGSRVKKRFQLHNIRFLIQKYERQ